MKLKTKISILISILLVLSGLTFINWHKFYLSLTEIRILPEKNMIEISMRIFPDDLDVALKEIYGSNPNIATEIEDIHADLWLEQYIHTNFSISINGENHDYKYLGKTPESGAVWCFLELKTKQIPYKLMIKNTLLTKAFEDQKNIIQVYFQDESKGLLLDKFNPSGSIIFNNTTSLQCNYHSSDKPL